MVDKDGKPLPTTDDEDTKKTEVVVKTLQNMMQNNGAREVGNYLIDCVPMQISKDDNDMYMKLLDVLCDICDHVKEEAMLVSTYLGLLL